MNKKFYYLIEDIDINRDKKPDGFLITKYKIDKKTLDKIFLKSKYVSFENFKKKVKLIKNKKGGQNNYPNNYPYMNNTQYNKMMNNPGYYPPQYNNYNHNQHQQYPPQTMVVQHQANFGNAFMEGLGSGLGVGFGYGIMEGLFDSF